MGEQRCPKLCAGRPVESALDSGLAPREGPHGVSKTRLDSSRWASGAGHLAFAMYAKEDEGPSGAGGVEDCDEDGRRQDLAEDLGPVAKLERYACSDIVFHRSAGRGSLHVRSRPPLRRAFPAALWPGWPHSGYGAAAVKPAPLVAAPLHLGGDCRRARLGRSSVSARDGSRMASALPAVLVAGRLSCGAAIFRRYRPRDAPIDRSVYFGRGCDVRRARGDGVIDPGGVVGISGPRDACAIGRPLSRDRRGMPDLTLLAAPSFPPFLLLPAWRIWRQMWPVERSSGGPSGDRFRTARSAGRSSFAGTSGLIRRGRASPPCLAAHAKRWAVGRSRPRYLGVQLRPTPPRVEAGALLL
ncbi:hypothetical protein ISCGN_000176 [Ixodes scapularis]